MRFKDFAIILSFVLSGSALSAHEGHPHGDEPTAKPGTISGGRLTGNDRVNYLDAGETIKLGTLELRQEITKDNQILYSSNYSKPEVSDATKWDGLVELQAPGGEILKAFSAKSSAKVPPDIKITSLSSEASGFVVQKKDGINLEWKRVLNEDAYFIQIIVEMLNGQDVTARLAVETKDDGLYRITPEALAKIPVGSGRIALKRISVGGFLDGKNEMVSVKTVRTKIVNLKLQD